MKLKYLISKTYLKEVEYQHNTSEWGMAGLGHVPHIIDLANRIKAKNILDYGSGCGRTANELRKNNFDVLEYEPGIESKRNNLNLINDYNFKTDLIICTDVLEHIERKKLINVLNHLKSINCMYYYVTVGTGPANRILSNGSNAHLIQEDEHWWYNTLSKIFKIHTGNKWTYVLTK